MYKTVSGNYKSGVVQLEDPGLKLPEGPVLVTFLESGPAHGPKMSPAQIAELRAKLASWEEDWNAPGMEAYDKL